MRWEIVEKPVNLGLLWEFKEPKQKSCWLNGFNISL